jgi:integrase
VRGTVEKYGPTWRIRWEEGVKPNGRRKQRSQGGHRTRKDAEIALAAELERVRCGVSLDARKIKMSEWLDSWLDSKQEIRQSTRRSYEGHIRVYLKPLIGNIPLASLRADHLDRMHEAIRAGEVRKPPTAATVRRIHATLRCALQSAFERRLITYNPADQVKLPAEVRADRSIWDPAQLSTFLVHAESDRLSSAFHLLAFTGLRRGELCGLRWSDIDLDAATATIAQQLVESGKLLIFGEPKTKRGHRVIPLDTVTVAVLKSHRAGQNKERLSWGAAYVSHDLVFAREDGAPLRPEYLSRHFNDLVKTSGLPRIVLHGLRHSHATHALAAGVDITIVSNRLGHSTNAFTADTYTRVLPETHADAAEKIARLVRAAGGRLAPTGSDQDG